MGDLSVPPPPEALRRTSGALTWIGNSAPSRTDSMKPSSAARAADPAPVLLRENVGPIAVLTLNRPQVRNTLTEAMLAALGEELASLAADNRIRAVVLTAKGPAFSGGHDLKELTARRRDPDGGRAYFRAHHGCLQRDDDADHPPAAAGDRRRPGHRHCRRLPIGGELRSRGRVREREIRRIRHQCRPVLLDAHGAALAQRRAQACDGDAAHRRPDLGARRRCASGSSTGSSPPAPSATRRWRSAARSRRNRRTW